MASRVNHNRVCRSNCRLDDRAFFPADMPKSISRLSRSPIRADPRRASDPFTSAQRNSINFILRRAESISPLPHPRLNSKLEMLPTSRRWGRGQPPGRALSSHARPSEDRPARSLLRAPGAQDAWDTDRMYEHTRARAESATPTSVRVAPCGDAMRPASVQARKRLDGSRCWVRLDSTMACVEGLDHGRA